MYWLVIDVHGEIGLISLQEQFLDQRLEVNPQEIVFYAELTTYEPEYGKVKFVNNPPDAEWHGMSSPGHPPW